MQKNIGLIVLTFLAIPFFATNPSSSALSQPMMGGPDKNAVPSVSVTSTVFTDFADAIEALGTTRANETVILTAKVTETVREILFEDGQTVHKDDTLVKLDSTEENANLRAAEAQTAEKRSAYHRAKGLEEQQIVSKATYEEKQAQLRQSEAEAQAIRSRISNAVIKAPFDGVLGLRQISVGALVKPGDQITTIDDLSQIKLDFDVPALYLQQLRSGLTVTGTVEGFGDRVFTGTVATIDTQIDTATRAVKVRAIVPNTDLALKPGLLMTVTLHLNPRKSITIPEGALIQQRDLSYVYVATDDNGKTVAKKRDVVRGARARGVVEIISGLAEGDRVLTTGLMTVRDGQTIKIADQPTSTAAPAAATTEAGKP